MNWGYRIIAVFAGFTVLIGTLVYKATHTKYELVSKDYYSEELRYQEKIDGMNNAAEAGDISFSQDAQSLQLLLPASLGNSADSAHAWFYCKTDASKDRKLLIRFTDGLAVIHTGGFAPEQYELKLQFTADNRQYYYTQLIRVP